MPEIEYSTNIDAPVERVWSYVETLPNWAPLMIGFQKLELVDDRRSVWTLRGDVGILSREVDIQADITLWEPLRRVEFTITGVTERITGVGSFTLTATGDAPAAAAGPSAATGAAPAPVAEPVKRQPWYRRLRTAIARFVLRRVMSSAAAAPSPAAPAALAVPAAPSAPPASGAGSKLTFQLTVAAGGPMAPMLELLMAPMLEPAAEDLASGIRKAVEAG